MGKFEITETLFPYCRQEYEKWCRENLATIEGLLDRCGPLGRTRNTYVNQASMGQNYPEIRYAVHLVENERFPKSGILYENYTLSFEEVQDKRNKRGPKADGARLVFKVFSEAFFRVFDQLYDLNREQIKTTRSETKVDLLAVDEHSHRVALIEVKKYPPGGRTTEVVQKHQLLTLAFAHHIVEKLGPKAFAGEPYDLDVRLIAFVEQADWHLIPPQPYPVKFLGLEESPIAQ